jgi:antitoxin Phd
MIEYTYSEARQKLALLLDQAMEKGEVRIRRKDGQIFILKPKVSSGSPLDVEGIDLGISTSEILNFIKEGRKGYLEDNSAE